MNLPNSLTCEQALGLGVGGERKEVFVPPPPLSPLEFARRCVIDDQARWILANFCFVLHFCGLRRSRSQ